MYRLVSPNHIYYYIKQGEVFTTKAFYALCSIFLEENISFSFFVYKKIFSTNKKTGTEDKIGAKKYVGQTFKVVEPIVDGTGKIAVGDTVWLAKSNKDIAKGKMVKVVDVEGTILIVE